MHTITAYYRNWLSLTITSQYIALSNFLTAGSILELGMVIKAFDSVDENLMSDRPIEYKLKEKKDPRS